MEITYFRETIGCLSRWFVAASVKDSDMKNLKQLQVMYILTHENAMFTFAASPAKLKAIVTHFSNMPNSVGRHCNAASLMWHQKNTHVYEHWDLHVLKSLDRAYTAQNATEKSSKVVTELTRVFCLLVLPSGRPYPPGHLWPVSRLPLEIRKNIVSQLLDPIKWLQY